MMSTIFFTFPGNELLSENLRKFIGSEKGEFVLRHFPDGETYVRTLSEVKGKKVVVVCTLDRPDTKFLPLYFFCRLLKEQGAGHVCLISPYLSYMRQDKQFEPGEAVTSNYFAGLLSSFIDRLITIDPHLHRHTRMSEIYSIPCDVLHAAGSISAWIRKNVERPLVIGPDSESDQWVSEVAADAGAPYKVLSKIRKGDHEVEISLPEIKEFTSHTPVLVDDIISTAATMIQTVGHLKAAGMKSPVCIGVHAVFAGDAFERLKDSGAKSVVTCDTIPHESNAILLTDMIASALISE
jgi:ribose-phosphate pyrophosphokinase